MQQLILYIYIKIYLVKNIKKLTFLFSKNYVKFVKSDRKCKSCDTGVMVNLAYIWRYIQIENSLFKLYYNFWIFYIMFDQINAEVVSIDFFPQNNCQNLDW